MSLLVMVPQLPQALPVQASTLALRQRLVRLCAALPAVGVMVMRVAARGGAAAQAAVHAASGGGGAPTAY